MAFQTIWSNKEPINGINCFFSEESFNKYSRTPSTLEERLLMRIRQVKGEPVYPNTAQVESCSADTNFSKDAKSEGEKITDTGDNAGESQPKQAGASQLKQTERTLTIPQSTPAKEQQKKKKCPELPHTKKVAPPRKSRFSHDQQKRYVYLYKKYSHRTSIDTTPEERGEIRELQILTSEVLEEQKEFQEFQEMLSNTAHKTDYTYMNPAARKYMEDYVHSRKKEAELYPKYYNTESSFNIDGEGQPSKMVFIKPLLQLGIVPKMMLPTVTQQLKPELPLDSPAVSQQYPVSKSRNHRPGAWNHEPCTLDDNATHLAVENRAHIVISAGALQCLVDNHAPKHLEEWEMPFVVREYKLKDGDKVLVQRVVYIDRPFLQPQLTPKDKNTKYFKYALKAFIARPSQKGHVFSKIDESRVDAKVGATSQVYQQSTNSNNTASSKTSSVEMGERSVIKKKEEPFSVGDISLEDLECFGTAKKKENTTAKNKQTSAVDMEIESQLNIDDLESFGTASVYKFKKTAEKAKPKDSDQDLLRKIKEMHKPQKQVLPTQSLAKENPALDVTEIKTSPVGNSSEVQEIHKENDLNVHRAGNEQSSADVGNVPKEEHSQPVSYDTIVKDSPVENININSENKISQMSEQNVGSSQIDEVPQMIPWRTPELFNESDQKTTTRKSERIQTRSAPVPSEEDSSEDEDKLFIMESPTKKVEVFDEAPASPTPGSPDPGLEDTEVCRIIPIGSDYTPNPSQSPARRQESPTSPVKGGLSDFSETMQCPVIPLCRESEDETFDTSCQGQMSKEMSHSPDGIFEKPVGTPLRRSGRYRKNSQSLDSRNTETGQTAQNTVSIHVGGCFSDTVQSCESDVHHEEDDDSKEKVMSKRKKFKKDVITSDSENEEKEIKPTAQPVKRKRGRPRKNPTPESSKAEENESEKGQVAAPLRMSTRSRSRSSVGGTSEDEVPEKEAANRSRRKCKSEAGGSKEVESEARKPPEDGAKAVTGLETKKDEHSIRVPLEISVADVPVQAKRPRPDNAENLLGNIGPHKRVSRVGRLPSTPAHPVTKPETNQSTQGSEVKSRESKKTNQQTHKAEDRFSLDSLLNVQQTLLKSGEEQNQSSFTAENSNHVYKFPQRNNVTYNLWDLGGFKVIVRCNIHGVIRDVNQQLSFVHLMPKLEYQCQFGMEQVTPSETARTWISSYIRPNCRVLRARFHTQRTELFSVEELQAAQIVPPSQSFSPGNGFLLLQNIFHHLHQLSPGQYLLSHKKSSDKCVIKKATEDNKRGSYDLHFNQLGFADPEFDKRKVQWTPLDPTIMLPYHTMNGRIPVTFDPPDFKFTYSSQNKSNKRKKKNKAKRKKNKNSV